MDKRRRETPRLLNFKAKARARAHTLASMRSTRPPQDSPPFYEIKKLRHLCEKSCRRPSLDFRMRAVYQDAWRGHNRGERRLAGRERGRCMGSAKASANGWSASIEAAIRGLLGNGLNAGSLCSTGLGPRSEAHSFDTESGAAADVITTRREQQSSLETQTTHESGWVSRTAFFRDSSIWDVLREHVVPALFAAADPRVGLRLWVVGCSTGEEAYSLALLLAEHADRSGKPVPHRVFATDVHAERLAAARAGVFSASACGAIPKDLLSRYFESRHDTFVASRALREAITFAPHDVLLDPPFTQLDLVSCRNLLSELPLEAQRRVLSRFRLALRDRGYLLLGTHELGHDAAGEFCAIAAADGLYTTATGEQRARLLDRVDSRSLPSAMRQRGPRPSESLYDAVLTRYAPPGVAVDAHFEILQVFGDVSRLMNVPAGRMTTNLLKMIPHSLSVLINSAGRRALNRREEQYLREVRSPDSESALSLRIVPIGRVGTSAPLRSTALLIFFEQAKPLATLPRAPETTTTAAPSRPWASEEAFQDLTAANANLQAANRDLTALNDELQSTNEELQSVNEELYAVNSEYQEKLVELEELNVDLGSLLRVIDAGVLFLDAQLNIRRFNQSATRLLPLREEDLGRPLHELAIQASYPTFAEDARRVLHSNSRHTATVKGHDGAWWSVGIRPFAGNCNPAGGVIVTTQEVSELKRTIADLTDSRLGHELTDVALGYGHVVWDLVAETVEYSPGACALLGLSRRSGALPMAEAFAHFSADDQQLLENRIQNYQETGKVFDAGLRVLARADGQPTQLRVLLSSLRDPEAHNHRLVACLQRPPAA
jgi:chemotaxis methyl-accepting protein methylase/PAS domain-containing protein